MRTFLRKSEGEGNIWRNIEIGIRDRYALSRNSTIFFSSHPCHDKIFFIEFLNSFKLKKISGGITTCRSFR